MSPSHDPILDIVRAVSPVSRRRFLEVVALIGGAAALPGCDGFPGGRDEDSLEQYYGMLEHVREGLRRSPDHLAARAERLAAGGDAAAIHAFVRDAIRTVPGWELELDNLSGGATRWGLRGALRGGMGTPREKAELLARMLRDAGFEAEVVTGSRGLSADQVRRWLVREPVRHEFRPELDERAIRGAAEQLAGSDAGAVLNVIENEDRRSRELGQWLFDRVPAEIVAGAEDVAGFYGELPVVRFTANGRTRYANPVDPDAELGDHGLDYDPSSAEPPEPAPSVRIAISCARGDAPERPIPLVEGTWSADQLVGRRVEVAFSPMGSPVRMLEASIDDLNEFLPSLLVDDPRIEEEEPMGDGPAGPRRVSGPAVTIGGDIIELDTEAGVPVVNGRPIQPVEGAAAEVASLEMEPSAGGYPTVELHVAARNAAGDTVPGLATGDFQVLEEGRPRPYLIAGNSPRPPRVLFILDLSGSVSEEFRSEGAADLVGDVAAEVLRRHPGAEFLVASILLGLQPMTDWTDDTDELRAAVLEGVGGSSLWQALGDAPLLEPTTLVFISDGDSSDEATPSRVGRAKQAPAGIFIHARGEEGAGSLETLERMAEVTGGVTRSATDPDAVAGAVVEFVDTQADFFYTLSYQAPHGGPEERRVELRAGGASATGSYTVPAGSPPRRGISGVFVTVEVGDRSVTRTLGGVAGPVTTEDGEERVPDEAYGEVKAAMIMGATLAFEGPPPTLSAYLEDVATAKLGTRAMARASADGADLDTYLEAAGEAPAVAPSALYTVQSPLPDGSVPEALTFPDGLQVALISGQAQNTEDGSRITSSMDILPLTRFASVAGSVEEAFRVTMERTAALAVREAHLYEISTLTRLDGRDLALLDAYAAPGADGWSPARDLERWESLLQRYDESVRLVPAGGDSMAFWSVDPGTGSLLGILGDGTGGGMGIDYDTEQLDKLQEMMGHLESLTKTSNLGAVVILMIWQRKMWTIGTMCITALGTGEEYSEQQVREEFNDVFNEMMCELFKELALGGIPGPIQSALEGLGVDFCDALPELNPAGA